MISIITNIDFSILNFIQNNIKCEFLDKLMLYITFLGNGGVLWIALGLFFIFTKKYRSCGAALLFGLLLCLIFGNIILKPLIARPRPCHIDTNIEMLINIPKDFSFPSGHTYSAFTAAFIILMYKFKRPGIAVLIIACLIAFSRLYLYVHFPTDIIGGILLAAVISLISYFISGKLSRYN